MTTEFEWSAAGRARLKIGERSLPLWLVAIILGAVGVGAGYALAPRATDRNARPTPSEVPLAPLSAEVVVAPTAVVSGASSAAVSDAKSTIDRARSGDLESLKRLEREPKRDVETELAILEGRTVETKAASSTLREDWKAHPELADDEHARTMLKQAARQTLTAVDALATMTEMPGALGADLLDDVASSSDVDPMIAVTARALVETDAMRARASAALLVKLDLARVTACEEKKRTVTRAIEVGDARSQKAIEALGKETGCGKDSAEDCFPCLRGDDLLTRARESVRSRKPQRF